MKTQMIKWQPFSEKHKRYIHNALKNKMNVAEGAIRSGKTIDHCIIASAYLENCRDMIHLASGSTIANAKLNIGSCNGFGLENIFRGRCRWGKYKDNEALFIDTKTGEKIVIFAGGGKADSYKRILGNSYGMWIATEINEHYDSDDSRTSFIKVAFGRQIAALDPFVLWDLNPCNPTHKIYTDYIDEYKDTYVGGYQYEHFTIKDNLSITPKRREEIESQYVKGTVWYRRDIEGERCIAEGLIYPMYQDALVDALPDVPASEYVVSIDYGTMNAFAAILWSKRDGVWYAEREYYYSGRDTGQQKTDNEYASDLNDWISDIWEWQKMHPRYTALAGRAYDKIPTIIDPSAASFIALLKKTEWAKVRQADNAVADGIRETATALQMGYIKILRNGCPNWINEVSGYVWDSKSEAEKPIKEKDHLMDSMRYMCKTMRVSTKNR